MERVSTDKNYALIGNAKVRSELMAIHALFIAEHDIELITPEEYVELQNNGVLADLPRMELKEVRLYVINMDNYDNFTDTIIAAEDIRHQRHNVQSNYGKNYYKQNRFKPGYIHKQRKRPRHGKS